MLKRLLAALVVAILSSVAGAAAAFDTGPHAQITEQAMAMAGYGRAAADVVQVENWLTDYYTSRPRLSSSEKCMLEKLHFDDVFSEQDIDAYWKTLLRNTLAAALKAENDSNRVEFFTVLGVSLHVVQDFYTHSNWVETGVDQGPAFDTTTYLQWSKAPWPRKGPLKTGWYDNCLGVPQGGHAIHGGYTTGMNHDSVVRPNFNRAYIYALAASYEWLNQVQHAIEATPGGANFMADAKNYQPSPADRAGLSADQQASLYISEWVSNTLGTTLDGHWNGNRSGYAAAFAAYTTAWAANPDSAYVRSFNNSGVFAALSQGLYEPLKGDGPPTYPLPLSGTVVDMRVGRVCANVNVGTESYFGTATPAGVPGAAYPIRDAALHHLGCTDTPWEYVVLAPTGSSNVNFTYTLSDEQGLPTPQSKTVAISGSSTLVSFHCALSASSCFWAAGNQVYKAMPASLKVEGGGWSGATLDRITIEKSPASPLRP